jgi:hypothetical protein
MELPDEIWNLIKEFALDWKKTHMKKLDDVFGMMFICSEEWGEIYERWTHPPPNIWKNTNDIIREEYLNRGRPLAPRDAPSRWAPSPNLELTSITWNPKENEKGGWWCGYGWNGWPDLLEIENK